MIYGWYQVNKILSTEFNTTSWVEPPDYPIPFFIRHSGFVIRHYIEDFDAQTPPPFSEPELLF